MIRRTDRPRTVLPALVMAAVLGLTGCAGSAYDAETARALQERVAAVSTAAASEDWPTTETELMELETETQTALARGEITQARADAIMASVALVRADVDAALEAERVAAEQAEAERIAAEEAARAAAEEAARVAEQEAAAQRAAEEAARDEERGNGNGKGKKNDEDDD
ncbi:hypothetical protein [Microcella flavibacter]|uniref:hypothetical protein n=1 Tax=Microcella flavibacter TaxID=1804990 RepID=UPI0014566799|nr:hypothetical protein [Microcella flavibacter]